MILLIIFILRVTIAELKLEKALIIEPTTVDFEDLEYPNVTLPFLILTACPPSTQQEKEFNEKVSLTGNSVFSRQFYPRKEYAKNIQQDICDQPFKPVMIYDYENAEYEIGYEIYYEDGKEIKLQQGNKTNYYRYRSVKYTKNQLDYERMNRTAPPRDFVIIYKDGEHFKFNFTHGNGTRTLIFHWIGVLRMKLHEDNKRIMNPISYKPYDSQSPRKCQDYDSADENIYSESNQETHLKDILIPSSVSEANNISCGQAYGCLVNSQVVSLLYFHSRAPRYASCSYINRIPVWKTIAEGQLKKVDVYLMAVDTTFLSFVTVAGVCGTLKMATTSHPNETRQIYLSDPKTQKIITVPRIIYRIIEYRRSRDCHEEADPTKLIIPKYAAAIIIHNDPSPIPDDERLCSRESALSGWDRITNEDPRIGLTYVCPVTLGLNEKLWAYDQLAPDTFQTFNLSALPFSHNITHWDPEDKVHHIDYASAIDRHLEEVLKKEYST